MAGVSWEGREARLLSLFADEDRGVVYAVFCGDLLSLPLPEEKK